jgi:hypothetical protein
MANYRQIHVTIWKDPWFIRLEPKKKLLFMYLFSNENASLSGIYELPIMVICFETGLDDDFVVQSLNYFSEQNKVHYDFDKAIVWVVNLMKYNHSPSPKVQERIRKDVQRLPDCPLKEKWISYGYGIDNLSTEMKCNEMKQDKDSAQDAPANYPVNMDGWLKRITESTNKNAELKYMFEVLYPRATQIPSFAYIGRTANNVGGAGRLAQLLWQCSGAQITGDVLRYVQGYHKNHKGELPKKRPEQKSAEEVLEDLENG